MGFVISSFDAQAQLWSGLLRSDYSVGELDGVDDDNTLAESGAWESYRAIAAAGGSALGSLSADAGNISAAAASYEQADAASAAGF